MKLMNGQGKYVTVMHVINDKKHRIDNASV